MTTNPTKTTTSRLFVAFGYTPFTTSDAAAAQVSSRRLQFAVHQNQLTKISRSAFLIHPSSVETEDASHRHANVARAVLRSVKGAVVSHESAAIILGLPVPNSSNRTRDVQLTIDGAHWTHGCGFRLAGNQLSPKDVMSFVDIPITTIARTAVDVARRHPLPDGLMTIDAAARRLIANDLDDWIDIRDAVHDPERVARAREVLRQTVLPMRGWKGVGHARAAIALADPAAESALESISRFYVHESNLPKPLIGFPVVGASGQRYWSDMCWKSQRVLGEADGAMKYATGEDLFAEKRREDDLRRAGWIFVRWTWQEAVVDPFCFISRLSRALRLD